MNSKSSWLVRFCLTALLALPPTSSAQTRLGSEFQVNTHTNNLQYGAAVAARASGDFVVAWHDNDAQDGSGYGVFARLFASTGAPIGDGFQINTRTLGSQSHPSVAMEANGDFIVVWEGDGDGSGFGVFARQFASAGTALASEFQVNLHTANDQHRPSVAADTDGDFFVAWVSDGQDGGDQGIFRRRFTSAGSALNEFQVTTFTPSVQTRPSVAAAPSGFVVAWDSAAQDGYGRGVFARRFSNAGTALASEFQVNSHTASDQENASVAVAVSGELVVAWESTDQDGSTHGVFARRFSSTGVALASELQVNSFTTDSQFNAAVAAPASGGFVIAWQSRYQDGSDFGVFARRFSSAGAALTREFQVNTRTADNQRTPAVAALAGDDFLVAWDSDEQDGSAEGVFAQRFGAPPPLAPLDVDGSGGPAQALTDGLLVLRYLFGFTGTTLTNGAFDAGACTRCDAAAIEPYLDGLGLTLDIDGSGPPLGPLTDGLLVLRYLFGFTGTTLTNGAVEGGTCSRCDAAAIEPYLAGLAG